MALEKPIKSIVRVWEDVATCQDLMVQCRQADVRVRLESGYTVRMILVLIFMIVAGIGLAQVVSDPSQVTLRWLRLGGLIAVTLSLVALVTARWYVRIEWSGPLLIAGGLVVATTTTQLLTVQVGKRTIQRVAAGVGCALAIIVARSLFLAQLGEHLEVGRPSSIGLLAGIALGAGLLGGFLMAMLLGHAYLTAGAEMTQTPFGRLVIMIACLLALRAVASVLFGIVPLLGEHVIEPLRPWTMMTMVARYLVGLIVPAVFVYMIYDCVQRRANQSATGILYVATVLVVIGEAAALSLVESTDLAF